MTRFNGCFSLRVSTCLFIFTLCGRITGALNEPVKVVVMEEDDVILPCSLSTKENIEFKRFDWKKDGQKEVFLYNAGHHYNNQPSDIQDRQFKGRVFHFQDELKHGNASIIIRNTKVTDSGNYTCIFPHLKPSQTFHIELVVGAAAKPSVSIIDQTNDWSVLQCAVRGAFPEPKVEWKDSSGNIVPAEEPKVTKRGDKYDVILQTTVTKTDHYHCVATQEEIHHQIDSKIFVHINEKPEKISQGAAPEPSLTILGETNDWSLLQCAVRGAFPEPKVEWKDSSGKTVHAEEPKVTKRGDKYDVILNANVTKTDRYHCVATQEKIHHQIGSKIFVRFCEKPEKISQGDSTGWIVAVSVLGILLVLLLVLVVGGVLYVKSAYEIIPKKSRRHENGSGNPPGSHHELEHGGRTEPLLPGSDVSIQTSPV